MHKKLKSKKEIVSVDGRLSHYVTYHDEKGDVFHRKVFPIMGDFHPKDLLQVIVGAAILAVPVGFTEETWKLGSMLPIFNIIGLVAVSFAFIATFVYYNYHSEKLEFHWHTFLVRVISTYIFSFFVVAVILGLIQVTPWSTDFVIALKRTVIVTFPSSMSAAVADVIR